MRILIIAGHGGNPYDAGACANGHEEAKLTREFASLLKTSLSKYAVVTLADTSKNWFEYLKISSFNFKTYDYVLEIHFNACVNDVKGDGYTTGTEIYIPESEKGCSVEKKILKRISSFGLRNRGVKRKNFNVIKEAKSQGVSAALLEVCFIDDVDDMMIYWLKKNQIAEGVAKGIAEGFGLEENALAKDCELLASAGIIDSPNYWAKGSGYSTSNTVLLIHKFAAYVREVQNDSK